MSRKDVDRKWLQEGESADIYSPPGNGSSRKVVASSANPHIMWKQLQRTGHESGKK
jgi:hypothetical protein